MDPRPVIHYRNTWKAYKRPVLTGVNLEIREGEMFALFGPSGTGKSVLLKTTIGLVVPDRGDVEVNGMSVYFGGPEARDIVRRQVGYVFQQAARGRASSCGTSPPQGSIRSTPRPSSA